MTLPLEPPDHSTKELAGDNMPVHEEEIGQSVFNLPTLIDNKDGTYTTGNVRTTDTSSLHPGKFLFGVIINRIMALLGKMVETMQDVAIAQAGKVSFFTQMQSATTEQLNTIHTFAQNNGDAFVSDDDPDAAEVKTARDALNSSNAQFGQKINATQNLLQNNAKQAQTSVNQTQQNVESCSNQLTSILQQLRSINSAVSQAK